LFVFKPVALHPVTTATFKALRAFAFLAAIQATRYAGGR
jgi:hypothetical protein